MFVLLMLSNSFVNGEEIKADSHNIIITTMDNSLQVTETLKIIDEESNQIYDAIILWLQNGANNTNILINKNNVVYTSDGNEYRCDIIPLNITMDTPLEIEVSYSLNKDIVKLSKTIVYNTSSLSVKFDGKEIYSSKKLVSGSSFDITLTRTIEAELNLYYPVIIGTLVLILFVTIFYSYKKQKTIQVKQEAGESEELLNTKKTLLMETLKDIEKRHRAKEISDDTYHKLREQYKQQAVETMKKIEDMKSKIK
jgi:hypothetical protein